MNPLDKTIKQIKTDEGLSLKPYCCSAEKLTIGVGRNLEDRGITEEEAEHLLNNDIKLVISELVKADEGSKAHAKKKGIPYQSIFIEQPEEIQSVLINMAFNLGTAGLLKFKKTLSFIAARRYTMASDEMLDSKWARQVGVRAKRLSKAVFECLPDSPNGNLHATPIISPLPSGYKVKIFGETENNKQEKELNDWLGSVGNIEIGNMLQSETSSGERHARTLTILYRFKDAKS